MIELKNVSKIYNVGGEEVKALDDVSLLIKKSEFVSIIGPSGSGKSTLMNIIGCLDIQDKGNYFLDGLDIKNIDRKHLAKIRNQKIGFIFQNFNLLPKLTAEENVELPLIYKGVKEKERKDAVEEALKRVNLFERRKHTPMELSGGQQQRVAIARAIATNPSILFCDEPTGNLDSKTGEEIMTIFHQLHKSGNTIVLITHDDHVANQAERKVKIFDGHLSEEKV